MLPSTYTMQFTLTAGECNARGEMPITLIAERFIEVASRHANALGIGYSELLPLRLGWVLSRLTVEVLALPAINSRYTFTTWIESINHRFSERCAVIRDEADNVCCHIRATWAAINIDTHQGASLEAIHPENLPIGDLTCPAAPQVRVRRLDGDCEHRMYTFQYCDLDFNRHVNTVRYIEMLLNCFTLDYHDAHPVGRFEIAFMHEAHYGETVDIAYQTVESSDLADRWPASTAMMVTEGDTPILTSRIFWK